LDSTARTLRAPRALPDDDDRLLTFEELVEKYEKKIFNLILRQIGDRDEAADLTQDTFVNAYRAFGSFRGECKISTWLCQIAMNHCKNRFRQRDRRRDVEGISLDAPASEDPDAQRMEIADWQQSPHRVLETRELQRLIYQAIHSLPPEYRSIIVLCDLQGHSYQEIATITGLTLEAVKTRIHRGRLMIRRKLSPYLNL
jgi:RNA polymerase sigma-70 factor (ECF subfamily)